MHSRSLVLLVLAACLPAWTAKADFQLKDAGSATRVPAITGPVDSRPPAATGAQETDDAESVPLPKPRVPYAQGFGHAVPLSFAARQIVPRNVAIRFGKDVDQTVPVDWRGGRPWNLVIGAAVKPLHLHLTFSRTFVMIS